MKKLKNIIKNNYKLLVGIIIGGVLFGSIGAYAATIAASSVSYTSNGQSNVNGALDELYTRANTWINPSTIQTNSTGKIFASSKGIVIRRNGATHFIKVNNWAEEQNHIQQVFSGVSCFVSSSYVNCKASDFSCSVYSSGFVNCNDRSDSSRCDVNSGGSVNCN